MKTQEEYAREIDEIVLRDVESCQGDWFNIDKEIFMQPENKNKAFILGTRKTGCDLIILGGTNCDEGSMDWLFGSLGNAPGRRVSARSGGGRHRSPVESKSVRKRFANRWMS